MYFCHLVILPFSEGPAQQRKFLNTQPGPSASEPGRPYPIHLLNRGANSRGMLATCVSPGCAARHFQSLFLLRYQPAHDPGHSERVSTRQAGAHMTFLYAAPAGSRWTGPGETFVSPIYLLLVKERKSKMMSHNADRLLLIPFGPGTCRWRQTARYYQRIRLVWLFMETVSLWRPRKRRRLRTSCPSLVAMRWRNPCTRNRR